MVHHVDTSDDVAETATYVTEDRVYCPACTPGSLPCIFPKKRFCTRWVDEYATLNLHDISNIPPVQLNGGLLVRSRAVEKE